MNRSASMAYLSAAAALFIWSGTAIANKIAVGTMSGLTAGVLRSMLAGLVAVVIILAMRLPFPAQKREQLLLVVSGVASFALWPALMSIGIEHTTAGHAALIMALIPIITVLFAAFIARRWPGWRWWLGGVLAIIGTLLLLASRKLSFVPISPGASIEGDLLVLAGSVICAIGYVAGARSSAKIGSLATTFWGLVLALFVLIPAFLLIADQTRWQAVSGSAWLAIGWLAFLSSLSGYVLWFFALQRGGIGRIGSLQLMMPVMTLLAAAIMLDETITWLLALACIVIIAGGTIAQRNAQ